MRLFARLKKLEHVHSANSSDLSSLTDEELITALRDALVHAGIDWSEYKNYQTGEFLRKFRSTSDDEDFMASFERTARALGDSGLLKIIPTIDTLERRANQIVIATAVI
jgi:hypothetical protein